MAVVAAIGKARPGAGGGRLKERTGYHYGKARLGPGARGGGSGFRSRVARPHEQGQEWPQGPHQPLSPTPRAIRVAISGMPAKPTSSMLRIQASRPARASLTCGSSPLRRGIAQRM